MRFYKATLKMRKPGDTSWTHELPKSGLSAPEILILRHIHGDDAVVNLSLEADHPVKHSEEIDRLRSIYVGRDKDGNTIDVVHAVFGPAPKLPQSVDFEEDEAEEVPQSKTLHVPKKVAA